MTFRAGLASLVLTLLFAGCSPPLGKVLITVIFENETRTQCIKTTARNLAGSSVSSMPDDLPRASRDTLQIGLAETSELIGDLTVTVARFATADCTGSAFASESKPVTVVHGAPLLKLEFRFAGEATNDGGTDGGAGDGGVDAGCDVTACGNAPGECETTTASGCAADGGCRFTPRTAGLGCDGGVCNSGGNCIANVCAVLPPGSACDDGLPCTPTSTCTAGVCQGFCAAAPQCNLPVTPVECDPDTATACKLVPDNNFTSCGVSGSQCLDGGCLPWLQFDPLNFPPRSTSLAVTPYPTGAWALASPDGGLCDTIISTGPTPMVTQGDCGTPVLTSKLTDAGVLVLTMTGLDVGPNARLSFVGTRPVQLVVIGDANISGIVSVAPLIPSQEPAGTGASQCAAAAPGTATKQGGGGGGFGAVGGRGGESGGFGGSASAAVVPLRGGCPGASGFRGSGSSAGGLGGGAIELIVSDTLTMNGGAVTASGGGGDFGSLDGEGGGGGGSGGTVIIEGRIVDLTGGAVTANGGGGGQGGGSGTEVAGPTGPVSSATAVAGASGGGSGGTGGVGGVNAAQAGANGTNGSSAGGGGGGGGAVGVVFVRGWMSCTRGGGVLSGNTPMSFTCT